MRKKLSKNKKSNLNQTSFYFEDYLETNKKKVSSHKKTIILKIEFIYYFFIFFINIYI